MRVQDVGLVTSLSILHFTTILLSQCRIIYADLKLYAPSVKFKAQSPFAIAASRTELHDVSSPPRWSRLFGSRIDGNVNIERRST